MIEEKKKEAKPDYSFDQFVKGAEEFQKDMTKYVQDALKKDAELDKDIKQKRKDTEGKKSVKDDVKDKDVKGKDVKDKDVKNEKPKEKPDPKNYPQSKDLKKNRASPKDSTPKNTKQT
jgi:hypothetical protein